MTRCTWSVSGLCVTAHRARLDDVEAALSCLPGIEVHASDPRTGKLIVVQEGSTVDAHQDGLREIQALPGVLCADLVMHYQDPENDLKSTSAGGAA